MNLSCAILMIMTVLVSCMTFVAVRYNGKAKDKPSEEKVVNVSMNVPTLNSTLNIQRQSVEIPQVAELPQNLKDVIDGMALKTFGKYVGAKFDIGFSDNKSGVEENKYFDRPSLWLPSSHYQAAVKYILSEGLFYDESYNRRVGKGNWRVVVSLPIEEGKIYSSAMEYWRKEGLKSFYGVGKQDYFNPKPLIKKIDGNIRPQNGVYL